MCLCISFEKGPAVLIDELHLDCIPLSALCG